MLSWLGLSIDTDIIEHVLDANISILSFAVGDISAFAVTTLSIYVYIYVIIHRLYDVSAIFHGLRTICLYPLGHASARSAAKHVGRELRFFHILVLLSYVRAEVGDQPLPERHPGTRRGECNFINCLDIVIDPGV